MMKNSFNIFAQWRKFTNPVMLLIVAALAYGWQIARLGFYWDDWVFVSRYQTMGIFNTIFYGGTRQLGVFALMPGFLVAGDSPLLWHIYSLLLRWCVALLFLWVVGLLWPQEKTATVLMSALFLVHPAFSQQSIAVVYSLQFVNYAIFLLSVGFTIKAVRSSGKTFWLWMVSALVAQGLHLFVVEYFVGLELIRPLVIYLALNGKNSRRRFWDACIHSMPYIIILIIYSVWRSGVLGGGFVSYDYKTITTLLKTDPRAALYETVEYGLKDIFVLLFNTWNSTISHSLIDLGQPYNFFTLGVAGLVAFGLYATLSRMGLDASDENTSGAKSHYLFQAAILGLWAVLVSFIPSWFVRRHIVEPGNFGDRFALAGLFGASILVVVCAQFFAGYKGRYILFAAIFIGLGVGSQMRYANNYRWDWERQLRTYWQVYWRLPGLQPGTALVGYEAISGTTVNYVGAFAFNNLYQPVYPPAQPSLWFVNYPKTTIPVNLEKFRGGSWNYVDEFDNIFFTVRHDHSIGVDYGEGRCVRVLSADDRFNYNLAEEFRAVAEFSNPQLIQSDGVGLPVSRIFGNPPRPTWCYYYQKADLARQLANWDEVINLKEKADKAGFEPLNAYELFPFIEAYAMRGQWQSAQDLSLKTVKSLPKTLDGVCMIWDRVGQQMPQGFEDAFGQINLNLRCR